MTPIFMTKNIIGNQTIRQIGNDGGHLKMLVKSTCANVVYEAIGFGFGKEVETLKKSTFDICYTIDENEFRGEKKIQLRIRDIKKIIED